MTERLAIIVPAYNEEAYLPGLLDSLLSQGFTGRQIAVLDNGSTDGTAEIASRYQCIVGQLPQKVFPSIARNEGVYIYK